MYHYVRKFDLKFPYSKHKEIKDFVNEVKNLGLFDDSSKSITLIEWPQLIQEKPKNLIELTFTYENDYQIRTVQVKGLN